MIGSKTSRTMGNAKKALSSMGLAFEERDGVLILGSKGRDKPIGLMVYADKENETLNIYAFLMFDIPEESKKRMIPEINILNNTINNGAFTVDTERNRVFFKIVQSICDQAASVKTVRHLVKLALKTVEMNDSNLMSLIPRERVMSSDLMYI